MPKLPTPFTFSLTVKAREKEVLDTVERSLLNLLQALDADVEVNVRYRRSETAVVVDNS